MHIRRHASSAYTNERRQRAKHRDKHGKVKRDLYLTLNTYKGVPFLLSCVYILEACKVPPHPKTLLN